MVLGLSWRRSHDHRSAHALSRLSLVFRRFAACVVRTWLSTLAATAGVLASGLSRRLGEEIVLARQSYAETPVKWAFLPRCERAAMHRKFFSCARLLRFERQHFFLFLRKDSWGLWQYWVPRCGGRRLFPDAAMGVCERAAVLGGVGGPLSGADLTLGLL